MPRAVKKVKVASGTKKHGKKFWSILISSIVVGVALITTLIVLLVVKPWKDDKDNYKYFSDVSSETTITYTEFIDSDNNIMQTYDHIFVFYYNTETFNPDDETSDKAVETSIYNLYNAINTYKVSGQESIAFYIIKTNERASESALTDSKSGVTETDQLAYYYNGSYSTYAYNNSKDYPDEIVGANISDAILFVNNLPKNN